MRWLSPIRRPRRRRGLEPPAGLDPGQPRRARQAEQLRETRRRFPAVRQGLALTLEAAVHETLEDPAIARRMEISRKGRLLHCLPLFAQAPEAPRHRHAPCAARQEVPDDAAALLPFGLVPHEALQQPRIGMVFGVFGVFGHGLSASPGLLDPLPRSFSPGELRSAGLFHDT